MISLGFRFTNREFTYIGIEGSFSNPTLLFAHTIKLPKDFSRPMALDWLHKELTSIISKHRIATISIKGMEPFANKNSLASVNRIENEALAFLVAAQKGIESVERIIDTNVAAKLRLEKKNKRTQAYEICQEKFEREMDDNTKDAVLAAWIKLTDVGLI